MTVHPHQPYSPAPPSSAASVAEHIPSYAGSRLIGLRAVCKNVSLLRKLRKRVFYFIYIHILWWWWLQHPSKDDEACAISGKRTTSNSKLNTSIRCGVRRGAYFVIFQQYERVIPGCKSYRGRSAISIIPGRSQARARGNRSYLLSDENAY